VQAVAQRSGKASSGGGDAAGLLGPRVVTGIGKAGLIGQKISATLASTGAPSYSLHPVDAIHGDLGGSSRATWSLRSRTAARRSGAGAQGRQADGRARDRRDGQLAEHAGAAGGRGAGHRADRGGLPAGLAPSASTTAMLALGDALALAVANRRKFDKEQFALYHPGGELGRKLSRSGEVMRGLDVCVVVPAGMTVTETLEQINRVRAGRVPRASPTRPAGSSASSPTVTCGGASPKAPSSCASRSPG